MFELSRIERIVSQIYFIELTHSPTVKFLFLYLLKYPKAASSQTATKTLTECVPSYCREKNTMRDVKVKKMPSYKQAVHNPFFSPQVIEGKASAHNASKTISGSILKVRQLLSFPEMLKLTQARFPENLPVQKGTNKSVKQISGVQYQFCVLL